MPSLLPLYCSLRHNITKLPNVESVGVRKESMIEGGRGERSTLDAMPNGQESNTRYNPALTEGSSAQTQRTRTENR